MKIDERELNKKLRKHTRSYAKLKTALQREIERHIKKEKPTELLWLCDKTGLCPKDATALYYLLHSKIDTEGHANLSTRLIDGLELPREEFHQISGEYKLVINPEYTFRFILVSDTHIGSQHDNIEGLEAMFDHAVDIEARAIFHAGDLTDGLKKHRDMYLYLRGDCQLFDQQYERVVEKWPSREGIVTYFIAGNHDHFTWDMVGVDICRHIALAREDMVYVKSKGLIEAPSEAKELGSGRIGAVRIGPYHLPGNKKNTILMMMHPGNGSAQTMSYKPQRIIANLDMLLKSFENMENSKGKRIKPHIVQIGHYHKADVNFLRNVHVFQSGTMKLPDQFHEVKTLNNMEGYWVVEASVKPNGDISQLGCRFVDAYVPLERSTRRVVDYG